MDDSLFEIRCDELNEDVNELIDEVRNLNDQVEMLKGMVRILEVPDEYSEEWETLKDKARSWDYYSNLVRESTDANSLTELIINYNALNSIKGES